MMGFEDIAKFYLHFSFFFLHRNEKVSCTVNSECLVCLILQVWKWLELLRFCIYLLLGAVEFLKLKFAKALIKVFKFDERKAWYHKVLLC